MVYLSNRIFFNNLKYGAAKRHRIKCERISQDLKGVISISFNLFMITTSYSKNLEFEALEVQSIPNNIWVSCH